MRNPLIIYKPMGDGAVLMDMASGDCYELNRTGREVWERLSAGLSIENVITELAAAYEINRKVLSDDVTRLLEDLARRGMLVPPKR